MWSIFVQGDGTFDCECRVQDGTERWKEESMAVAVKSVIKAALVLNNHKITKKDIAVYDAVQVVETKWVRRGK